MNQLRKHATTTGYLLIAMAIVAGLSIDYALPQFFDANHLEINQNKLSEKSSLYIWMLWGIVSTIILDIWVSFTIYQFFKNDDPKIAQLSLTLRLLYSAILGIATYFLIVNLYHTSDNDALLQNFILFQRTWSWGLIVFGLHLFAVGMLMKLHKHIPTALWILTLTGGICYVVVHFLKSIFPELSDLSTTLNNVLALPMALAELGLAIWLIAKGGKQIGV